jgi:hypothetical protein
MFQGHNVHEQGEEGLTHHLTKTGTIEQGAANILRQERSNGEYINGKEQDSPV